MSEGSQGKKEIRPKIENKANMAVTDEQAALYKRAADQVGVRFDILASEGQKYQAHSKGGVIRGDGTITKPATYTNTLPKGHKYIEITSESYDKHQDFWNTVRAEEAKTEKTAKPPQT